MIYLYLKTHNVTGLKYLGKTVQDPNTYHGSGKRWRAHLRKHGIDLTTEILYQCEDPTEFRIKAKEYSQKWNIVESSEFANLSPEEGQGGYTVYDSDRNEKISKALTGCIGSMKGKSHSPETLLKMSKAWDERRKRPPIIPSEETRRKMSESRRGQKAWNKGIAHKKETLKKMSETRKGRPQPRVECPHCRKMVANNLKNRLHFDNCREKV
jgi:hypothetical protein